MAQTDDNKTKRFEEIQEVLEQSHQETADSFVGFVETCIRSCIRSGIHIERDEFLKLIMDRMRKAFDRFRAEEMEEDSGATVSTKEESDIDEEVTELVRKVIGASERTKMDDKERLIDLMRYGADAVKKNGGQKQLIGVNMKSREIDDDSLIVSFEMSSSNAPGGMKLSKRAVKRAKKQAKKTKMTITALMERQPSGNVSQQVTITKEKSGKISIKGISIQTEEKCPSEPIQPHNNAKSSASNDEPNKDPTPTGSDFSKIVKYRCAHCQDVRNWIESFDAPKDVYMHWLSSHTDLSNTKPFQYSVIEYAKCFYCQKSGKISIGTYNELIKHHKKCHYSEPFVIASQKNGNKCALCSYTGSGIVEHFASMHKLVVKTLSVRSLRSSVLHRQLNDTILNELLASRLHRRHKCAYCKAIFETENGARDHHQKFHRMVKLNIHEFFDANYHFICNCCHVKVDRNLYLNHIECSAFDFKCSKCDFRTKDMLELVKHDKQAHSFTHSFENRCMQFKNRLIRNYLKTQVVFGNGLILTKQNLLQTKYDDSKQFNAFIDALVKIKKERHNLELTKN